MPVPPSATLLPYTTLFRSEVKVMRHGKIHWSNGLQTLTARRLILAGHYLMVVFVEVEGVITNSFVTRLASIVTTDRKSTRLNSSHLGISYAVFCLKKKR